MVPHRQIAGLLVVLWLWSLSSCCPALSAVLVEREADALAKCRRDSATAYEEEKCGEDVLRHFDAMHLAVEGDTNR